MVDQMARRGADGLAGKGERKKLPDGFKLHTVFDRDLQLELRHRRERRSFDRIGGMRNHQSRTPGRLRDEAGKRSSGGSVVDPGEALGFRLAREPREMLQRQGHAPQQAERLRAELEELALVDRAKKSL